MTKRCVLITSDVETTSILNHKLRDKTADYLLSQGMPRLLDLYDRYSVKATFFFTGHVAKLKPKLVKMAKARGHEIASHGLTHDHQQAFDVLSLKTQIRHLEQSKYILEDISGEEIVSFRAPAGRVHQSLTQALEIACYKIDSSISSQRFDMMFSFGGVKKLNWFRAPRLPYFAAKDNIFKKGDSSILEIPVSAFGFPYIGTLMRISPLLIKLARWLLYLETMSNSKPINFLTHPNEYIDEDWEGGPIARRGRSLLSYLLGDIIRHRIKIRNLGARGLPLLGREIEFFKKRKFSFISCRDYYDSVAADIRN